MRERMSDRRWRWRLASLMLAVAPGAHGESPAGDGSAAVPQVTVEGRRAGLSSGQQFRQAQDRVVEVVMDEEAQALPDFSVADVLQRISGVQMARDRGEGSGVSVRGLGQVATTLNGREVFTAGNGRVLDFADFPSEMVAAIELHKSSTAAQIEGAIGGLVNLRTHRPFDFSSDHMVLTARGHHDDLAGSASGLWSVLASQRWRGAAGEVGVLINLVRQRRAFREDQSSNATPGWRSDLLPGPPLLVPGGIVMSASAGTRSRDALTGTLQWRLAAGIELFAEASLASLRTRQDTYQLALGTSVAPSLSERDLISGSNVVGRIAWRDAPAGMLSFARDTADHIANLALGGRVQRERWWFAFDLARSAGDSTLYFAGPVLAGRTDYILSMFHGIPGATVPGGQLVDARQVQLVGIAYRHRSFSGALRSMQVDGGYHLGRTWFKTVTAGVRLSERSADNGNGTVIGDTALAQGVPLAGLPALAGAYPYGAFFPGAGPQVHAYLAGNLDLARNIAALRAAAGLIPALPPVGAGTTGWRISERMAAAYVEAHFEAVTLPLEASVGLRVAYTGDTLQGSQNIPACAVILPVAAHRDGKILLPSASIRYGLSPHWQTRAILSRTMSRPDFDQLSPSVTLAPYTAAPGSNTGIGGNPALQVVDGRNFDMALEYVSGVSSSASLTLFHKRVDGLIGTASRPESHAGQLYQVVRPYNLHRVQINGIELGYRRLYDFLPGWLGGLGLQANYSYIQSAAADTPYGSTDLPNVSAHSANLIGIYERGGVSARLAYNWRDEFLSGASKLAGYALLPLYTQAYGWLDGAISFKVNARVKVQFAGTNLLRTVRRSVHAGTAMPGSAWVNGRQYSMSASLSF